MGSLLSRIEDDYDDYLELCKSLNEEPVPIEGKKHFMNTKKNWNQVKNKSIL